MDTNVFDSIATPGTEAPATAPAATADNSEAKKRAEEMKAAFRDAMMKDPTMASRLHSLSDSLEVVNSLGYGDSGNIVVNKERTAAEGKRVLASTSACVGYRVRNIGTTPINYTTEIWTRGEDGKWAGSRVEKVLEPSATADLPRQYMTMLAAQPEFSFRLANGSVRRGSGAKTAPNDLKAELEAHHFAFSKEAAAEGKEINSDDVKLNVGQKDAAGKWTVKPEYQETFGYLENVEEKPAGSRKSSAPKYSSSDIAANWICEMLKGNTL